MRRIDLVLVPLATHLVVDALHVPRVQAGKIVVAHRGLARWCPAASGAASPIPTVRRIAPGSAAAWAGVVASSACSAAGLHFLPRIGIAVSSTCCCSLGLGAAGALLGVSVASTFWFTSSAGNGSALDRFTWMDPPRPDCPRNCDETVPSSRRNPPAGAQRQMQPQRSRRRSRNRLRRQFPLQVIAPVQNAVHALGSSATLSKLSCLLTRELQARPRAPLRIQRLRHDRHIGNSRLLHRIHHAGKIPKRYPLVAAQINRLVRRIHARLVQLFRQIVDVYRLIVQENIVDRGRSSPPCAAR